MNVIQLETRMKLPAMYIARPLSQKDKERGWIKLPAKCANRTCPLPQKEKNGV